MYPRQDILGNRSKSNTLAFDSYAYQIKNTTHSVVAQVNSNLGNSMSNEFIAGFTSIRDRRAGVDGKKSPEIKVKEIGLDMSAGVDQYSSANELDQDISLKYLTILHIY